MLARPFCLFLMAWCGIFCASTDPAHAIGIDERQVSLSLGETLGGGRGTSRAGVQAGMEAAIGLSDSWAARGGARFAWQPTQAYTGSTQVSALSLGATYSLDIVRWVPFLDLGVSLADWRGNGISLQSLGPQAGLGVELLLSRRWTLATLARLDYLVLRLSGPAGAHPWLGWIGLRLGRVF